MGFLTFYFVYFFFSKSVFDSFYLFLFGVFWTHPQNYKWQNGKQYKGKPNRVQPVLARRMCQGCTGPPPPLTPVLHRVAAKFRFCNFGKFQQNFYFCVSRNFPRISQKSKLFCQNFVFREILTKQFFIFQNWRKICETLN